MFFAPGRTREKGFSQQAGYAQAPRYSALAVLVAVALQVPHTFAAEQAAAPVAGSNKDQTLTVEASAESATDSAATDYSVPVTSAGTKMPMIARDIPQSVSIISKQRMEDQQLQSLGQVLYNTTAIQEGVADMDRRTYYSRGFLIDNYMVDGIPTVFETRWNLGDSQSDTAMFERIEVVRGASGLMTGTGNPSASINMIHKHADSREFAGNVSASYGSWNKQRYVADLSAPLSESGNVRGRIVAGYQDGNSFVERYSAEKKFLYGVVDADLTDSTTLTVGYEYQETNANRPTWGGAPRWYTDGSKTDYRRGFNSAPDWAYNDKQNNKVFANLKQSFDNGWQANLTGTHNETLINSKQMYIDGYFDKTTGLGVSRYQDYDVVAGTGYNSGKRKVNAVDAYASGPFELLGRQHELMMGLSYTKQKNTYYSSFANISSAELGNFNDFNSSFPETDWGPRTLAQEDIIRKKSAYMATRLSLADPLHLILGARYTNYNSHSLTQEFEKNNVSPYAGLVFDINENWSTYASYTSVFQPQTQRDINRSFLSPVIGKNYEAGVKSDWFNSRLTTSVSVFRAELDNVAQTTNQVIPGTAGETAYKATDGTVSRGVEFEINGAITDNWQMTFGGTRYIAEERDGTAVNPQLPRTQLKLFTSYRLPMLQEVTVGGGVNWQTHVWSDIAGPDGNGTLRAEQGSYALVNLFSRYQVTKQLSLQANLNNLFDKEYDTTVDNIYTVYGEPRNFSLTASYQF
ncbi:ferric-rhodotorulic acid/ferric-coprogen receptor FhuE [Erwinia sp. MMLR14_017]|uniref:ferric-rhodotorulic acid/ferric-coprogen receptor FhuE n=1 Tax=Erwinia sp. MMLR14_017 TaxID=3093842 RepID=UPI00298FB89A|nr:ferric-rhodotorulic acid/ferric-coprogen receptor FhuE [Erwinia sp. MMLR14_017]MDW8847819.1 ferric-rhodotorulic acid/ferric-coprogen receptor FhuE [Erwinia sp. MMLR14_017]